MTERADLLAALAARIPRSVTDDCVLVGVDGLDGAGKTTFADELSQQLRGAGRAAVRVSVDDFHHAREIRYRRGRCNADGFGCLPATSDSARERATATQGAPTFATAIPSGAQRW